MKEKILAIIPARSGSKGLKDKNILEVEGRPLIDFTIKAALNSNCFDTVMVSTDSSLYSEIAKKCGADVPFLRSLKNSSDASTSWDVVREVLTNYKQRGKKFDYVALLQPTSPLRTENDIIEAIRILTKNKNINSVVSVTEVDHPVQWCFKLKNDNLMKEFGSNPDSFKRRQELEKYYRENGALYLVDAKKIMDQEYNIYLDNCFAYVMSRENSIDIDEELDLFILKSILKKGGIGRSVKD